jgi:hypothetical protein
LRFGKTGTETSLLLDKHGHPKVSYQDVNGDGRLDLVITVVTSATNLQVTDTQAVLTGKLVSGVGFESFGPVQVVNTRHGAAAARQTTAQPASTSATVDSSSLTLGDIATPLFVDVSDDPHKKLQ